MKNIISKSKIALLALIFIAFTSCDSEDKESDIKTPVVYYSVKTIDATFFEAGNSSTPTLSWNGEKGDFSLTTPITGLSINPLTGVLNWTKDLPAGTYNIEVVVVNSAGQTTDNLILNNPFQGTFTGTYDNTSFFELEFVSDGSLNLTANANSIATGTWTRSGSTINTDYTYENGSDEYSTTGILTLGTNAVYSGDYYIGHGAVSGNEGGVFEVTLN